MKIDYKRLLTFMLILVSSILVFIALIFGLSQCCATVRNIMGWNVLSPEEMAEAYYKDEEPLNAIAEGLREFPNIYIMRNEGGIRSDWCNYPLSAYTVCNKDGLPLTAERLRKLKHYRLNSI